jgi:hypothetical protein
LTVRHVATEPEEVEELEKKELEEAWVDVCEKAERICAVGMQRNDESGKRSQFNSSKSRTLSKTFRKRNQNIGVRHTDICWGCANNDSKKGEYVHTTQKCPLNRPAGRGRGRDRGRRRGRVNRVGEDNTSNELSQAEQQDMEPYISDSFCSLTST